MTPPEHGAGVGAVRGPVDLARLVWAARGERSTGTATLRAWADAHDGQQDAPLSTGAGRDPRGRLDTSPTVGSLDA